jgi:hypothetical protein
LASSGAFVKSVPSQHMPHATQSSDPAGVPMLTGIAFVRISPVWQTRD